MPYGKELVGIFIDCYGNFIKSSEDAQLCGSAIYDYEVQKGAKLGETKTLTCKPLLVHLGINSDSGDGHDDFIIIHELNITNKPSYIKYLFDKTGTIVLRPYMGEKTLVIGCGNRRLADSGSESFFVNKGLCVQFYNQMHQHYNEYTVDINANANPCVIADLSFQSLDWIPDGSFDNFYMEGGPELWKSDHFYKELARLLGIKDDIIVPSNAKEKEVMWWDIKIPESLKSKQISPFSHKPKSISKQKIVFRQILKEIQKHDIKQKLYNCAEDKTQPELNEIAYVCNIFFAYDGLPISHCSFITKERRDEIVPDIFLELRQLITEKFGSDIASELKYEVMYVHSDKETADMIEKWDFSEIKDKFFDLHAFLDNALGDEMHYFSNEELGIFEQEMAADLELAQVEDYRLKAKAQKLLRDSGLRPKEATSCCHNEGVCESHEMIFRNITSALPS